MSGFRASATWPRWTRGPGAGGSWKVDPEDFVVEELAAEPPTGEGEHRWLRVEKRGLGTLDLVERLARAAGVPPESVGYAGLKDRDARTVQDFTWPGGREVEDLGPDTRILARDRTRRRLRVGHLAGNRFTIRVRGGDAARAEARVAQLRAGGMPNYYGVQRVGGRAPDDGRAILRGGGPRLPYAQLKFALSAYQSLLFNRVLATRGAARLEGDLVAEGDGWRPARPDEDAVPTGPMYGPEMPWPTGAAGRLEHEVLDAEGLPDGAWSRFPKLTRGTRRALWVAVAPTVEPTPDGFWLRVELPAGSYATVLLEEVV